MFSKIRSLIFKLDPELAHYLAIKALKLNYFPNNYIKKDSSIETKVLGKKIYKTPKEKEKVALKALIKSLDNCNDKMAPEDIQTNIFTVGKENGYKENLREWFKLIYEVVFGDENGPRMGYFISFFGVNETKQLIEDKIK